MAFCRQCLKRVVVLVALVLAAIGYAAWFVVLWYTGFVFVCTP